MSDLELKEKATRIYNALVAATADTADRECAFPYVTVPVAAGGMTVKASFEADVARQIIVTRAKLPFITPECERDAMATAVSRVNLTIADGNFDYNHANGKIFYRHVSCTMGCEPNKTLYTAIVSLCKTALKKYIGVFTDVCDGKPCVIPPPAATKPDAPQKREKACDILLSVLDAKNAQYSITRGEKRTEARFTAYGHDLPMEITYTIADGNIKVLSRLPFTFCPEHRLDGAIVTNRANYRMVDGHFDFDPDSGAILFELCTSYRHGAISRAAVEYIYDCSVNMIDEFNDKFMLVDRGVMSVEEFFKQY